MKYFCREKERKGTCYHEFQRGRWDGKTFWKEDSLLLDDDILWQLGFEKLLKETLPHYDAYAETEVSRKQWNAIMQRARELGGELQEAVEEADTWIRAELGEEECFTILGL